MKITKEELEELNEKGRAEIWTGMSGSENWVTIEVKEE